jgi:hypothetical protein
MFAGNVRWYCCYSLSYRDLEKMMQEREVELDHSTLNRWVLKYAPELDKRIRRHLKLTTDSWRVDETYIKIKGVWKYLYRAVDSEGSTLDFMLSDKRDGKAAGLSTNAIAHNLNQAGFRPPKRTDTFNAQSVADLLRSLGLTQPDPPSLPTTPLQPHEWWLTDLAATLQMPPVTLYCWLRQGLLQARQLDPPSRKWIVWADEQELDRLHQFRHRSLSEESRQRWRNQHPPRQCHDPLDTP